MAGWGAQCDARDASGDAWYRRRSGVIGIAPVVMMALAACGGTLQPAAPGSSVSPAPSATAADNTAPAPTLARPSEGPLVTDAAEPTQPPATPAQTGGSVFYPITLKGSGDGTQKFTIPVEAAAIATITHSGSGTFTVWSVVANGSEIDPLVDVTGTYKGTVLFNVFSDEHSVAMRVEASGSWTIAIKPASAARVWTEVKKATGTGDDVLRLAVEPFGDLNSFVTNKGSSNFAIWSYTSDGYQELLVNEIGNFGDQVYIPNGLLYLVFQSDGTWSITPPA